MGSLQVRITLEGRTPHPVISRRFLGEGICHGEHAIEERHQPAVQEKAAFVIDIRGGSFLGGIEDIAGSLAADENIDVSAIAEATVFYKYFVQNYQ